MRIRPSKIVRLSLYLIALAVVLAGFGGPLVAAEPEPIVSLILSKASAKVNDPDVLFVCEFTIDNATGKELVVKSHMNSAFDGLELVVTDKDGKTLAQQQFIYHQSPYSGDTRDFPIKRGTTSGKIAVPIRDLFKPGQALKVRVVGTLPGSSYERILSTETLDVTVKE